MVTVNTVVITENTITQVGDETPGPVQGHHVLLMSPDIFATQSLPDVGAVTIGRSSKCEIQLEDPMVSREHARLHVVTAATGSLLSIEDLGSANGTRLRDSEIKVGERVPIQTGEAVMLGSTVMMALPNRAAASPRRLWSHAYFESRVDDECARAAKTATSFALARVRFTGAAPWNKVLPVLARDLTAPHIFAAYGPKDYEILFLGVDEGETATLVAGLETGCRAAGLETRFGVAWYPKDGRNADALLGAANALLKVRSSPPPDRSDNGVPEVAAMQRVRNLATRVAASPINVLITGECGAGKDVLAQLIHRLSPRSAQPFVAFNCAALSEGVLESELFGHERGAFTGASIAKTGLLEAANGGTVFLDEIGDMPAPMQAKLLRAIESREIKPVGSVKSRSINVRFISATNKDLDAGVERGEFRRDLLDRLNTMALTVPPLRERTDEIPALATTFVAVACREIGRETTLTISADVFACLLDYRWPGNIRELKNIMERAVALCDGPEIRPEHLPLEKMRRASGDPFSATRLLPTIAGSDEAGTIAVARLPALADPEKAAERRKIVDALAVCNGNQTRAAQMLAMPRRTFVSKLDQYGIPRPQKRTTPIPPRQ